jgi:hypothetical protein
LFKRFSEQAEGDRHSLRPALRCLPIRTKLLRYCGHRGCDRLHCLGLGANSGGKVVVGLGRLRPEEPREALTLLL